MSEPFWTPLGGQPVDYEGAWAAGTQYAPGDVVTYQGVTYLAVNPSLGSTPPAALVSGAELAYAEMAATQNVSAVGEATPVDVVALPSTVLDGSPVIVEFYCGAFTAPSGAGASIVVNVWRDAVDLGRIVRFTNSGAGSLITSVLGRRKVTPAPGSYVLRARAWVSTGAGQIDGLPPCLPVYLRVTRA